MKQSGVLLCLNTEVHTNRALTTGHIVDNATPGKIDTRRLRIL